MQGVGVLLLVLINCAFSNNIWDDWSEESEYRESEIAQDRRRSQQNVQCGDPEGFIPCLTYGFAPAGPANVGGCLDIQASNCEWQGRSITCHDGFYAVAPATPEILIGPAAPFGGCHEIDECGVYGYSGRGANTASCSQPGPNVRIICCAEGFYPSGTSQFDSCIELIGASVFGGCLEADECLINGYSGNPANTVSCVDGVDSRTITCATGYYAVAPISPVVTLKGNAGFDGCTEIDTCEAFGYSGKPDNTAGCIQNAVYQRTLSCLPGYGIAGTSGVPPTTTVTLTGPAVFTGCVELDNCVLYGFSGKPGNTSTCTNSINARTITCAEGFYPVGSVMGDTSITLVGSSAFAGCAEENMCTVYGFSSRPDNTKDCIPGEDVRTIDCNPGYHALGSTPATSTTITLHGPAVFEACELIDNCLQYGFSGNRSNAVACQNGVNQRTIICDEGYYAVPPNTPTITLIADAKFLGCGVVDMCAIYGYSNHSDHAISCQNNDVFERNITCGTGYYPLGGPQSEVSIVVLGTSPFQGCAQIDECGLNGYSGNANYTSNCSDILNGRIITCLPGYYAIAPNISSITLMGNAPFLGCSKIDTCLVYGTSGHPDFVESCFQRGVNQRTITCNDGYGVVGYTELPQITLNGSTPFPGCKWLNMCDLYGTSGKPDHVFNCTPGIDNRTILCNPGYHIMSYEKNHVVIPIALPFANPLLIVGYEAFDGCFPYCGDGVVTTGEECDTGNTNATDTGCANCTVLPGYVCGTGPGVCCFAGKYYKLLVSQMGLVCMDGWWMSPHDDRTISIKGITSDSSAKRASNDSSSGTGGIVMTDGYLKLCGVVHISQLFTIQKGAILYVAGPLDVVAGGYLSLETGGKNPIVVIREPCNAWVTAPTGNNINDSGLIVWEDGLVEIVQNSTIVLNPVMDCSTTTLVPFFDIHGCSEFYGNFRYVATAIPQQNNYFPYSVSGSWTNCTFNVDVKDVSTTLPSCPIIYLYNIENYINVGTATHRMCPGAIAGLTIGCTVAFIIAVALLALLQAALAAPAATTDYVTL